MTPLFVFEVNCPHCKKSLMDPYQPLHKHPSIRLKVVGQNGEGTLRLCAIYDCYDQNSELELVKDELVKVYCPSCNADLQSNMTCEVCSAPMVNFTLEIGGKVNVCSRKGCTNHNVNFVDLGSALDILYDKYGYGQS